MAQTQDPAAQIADLQNRIKILTEQFSLLTAQYNLEAAKAKLPFAELAAVKEALGNMQLPKGKEGTINIDVGKAGTELLRSKGPLFTLLDVVAGELTAALSPLAPEGIALVTDAQLEQAYRAKSLSDLIQNIDSELRTAIIISKPKDQEAAPPAGEIAKIQSFLPPFAAAAYSLGFIADTVNSLGKLFRVDRTVEVFSADAEVVPLLGYLLEIRSPRFVAKPDALQDDVLAQAKLLMDSLNNLLKKIREGDDLLARLKKIEEDEAKNKPAKSALPLPEEVAVLKAMVEAARSVVDGLDISKKADAFWVQVKGQMLFRALENKKRLSLEAKGQAVLITESRWFWSDRLIAGGELQVAYRLCDANGTVLKAGLILKASKPERMTLKKMPAVEFPAKAEDPVKK